MRTGGGGGGEQQEPYHHCRRRRRPPPGCDWTVLCMPILIALVAQPVI